MTFKFPPPVLSPQSQIAESRANPLLLNILPVSTFTAKILRRFEQLRPNEFKDLACPTSGASARMAQFPQLSPALSGFYPQVLSFQRFCSCLPAKLMIPKDHAGRGYTQFAASAIGEGSRSRANRLSSSHTRFTSVSRLLPSAFPVVTPLHSRFCLQLLSIQRFCSCLPAN